MRLQTRYLDALAEVKVIEHMHDNEKHRAAKLNDVKDLKARVFLNLQRYDEALEALKIDKENEKNPH